MVDARRGRAARWMEVGPGRLSWGTDRDRRLATENRPQGSPTSGFPVISCIPHENAPSSGRSLCYRRRLELRRSLGSDRCPPAAGTEETTAPPHEHQQTTTGRMVLRVALQMLGEVRDPLLSTAICTSAEPVSGLRTPVLRDDLESLSLGQRHTRQGYQTTRTALPRLPWSEPERDGSACTGDDAVVTVSTPGPSTGCPSETMLASSSLLAERSVG